MGLLGGGCLWLKRWLASGVDRGNVRSTRLWAVPRSVVSQHKADCTPCFVKYPCHDQDGEEGSLSWAEEVEEKDCAEGDHEERNKNGSEGNSAHLHRWCRCCKVVEIEVLKRKLAKANGREAEPLKVFVEVRRHHILGDICRGGGIRCRIEAQRRQYGKRDREYLQGMDLNRRRLRGRVGKGKVWETASNRC